MKFSGSLKFNHIFQRLYHSRGISDGYLALYARKNRTDRNRVGITVSKKLGHAVVRNRMRRRLREIYRLHEDRFLPGCGGGSLCRSDGKLSALGGKSRYPSGGSEMKALLLALIRFYQSSISPWFPARCRFRPTCSAYAYEAISRYGPWKGGYLAIRRLLRCHPFSHRDMYDPVP